MSRVETLNYNDFYWNDDGIFLSYLIDDNEIKLQVLIDIIDTFPKNERKEIYPYIFIAGMGQLSTLIKKYMPHKTVISCKKISNDDQAKPSIIETTKMIKPDVVEKKDINNIIIEEDTSSSSNNSNIISSKISSSSSYQHFSGEGGMEDFDELD